MVSTLEELGDLLKEHQITIGDIEYIIKYLSSENISTQLAMRRIKAFEQIKEKLENETDKIKVEELKTELEEARSNLGDVNKELSDLQNAKTGLEYEKQELETKSDMLDSERDELQRQLHLLQELKFDDEPTETTLTEKISSLIHQLESIETNHTKYSKIVTPIKQYLASVLHDNVDIKFAIDEYTKNLENFVNTQENKSEFPETQEKLIKPSSYKIIDTKASTKSLKDSTKKVIKKVSEDKGVDINKKALQVINLFTDFINEANNDKSFSERVTTICDMDEAYQYLGSIGLSQVYSFVSKGIVKKDELMKLFESWKRDGVPR